MGRMHVILNGEPVEEVNYLGRKWQLMEDMVHRMQEEYRAWGALKGVLSNRELVMKAKKCLYEGVIVPTELYGAEAWGMRSADRTKIDVLEMKCLRSSVGVSRTDRVKE